MLLAENKYKIRKVRQTWNERTPEEEKIIALEAQIRKMGKGDPNKGGGKGKGSGKDGGKKKPPPNDKKKTKGGREPEPWMLVAPKEGEAKEKTVENKRWFWCPKHAKWTRHKPEECKGINGKFEKKNNKDRNGRLARAVAALAEESGDEE